MLTNFILVPSIRHYYNCFRQHYFRIFTLLLLGLCSHLSEAQVKPTDIEFIRQGVRRYIFDQAHNIPLAALKPAEVIGMSSMYPVRHLLPAQAKVTLQQRQLHIASTQPTQTTIWLGGLNPFATYSLDLDHCDGEGAVGFQFTNANQSERLVITLHYNEQTIVDIRQKIVRDGQSVEEQSIAIGTFEKVVPKGTLLVQLLGSGVTVYMQQDELPIVLAQGEFAQQLDLRQKNRLLSFQSNLFVDLKKGHVRINEARADLTSGMGLADIRAITYEDGKPLLDQGRIWYTMSIRGRGLPHPLQGVFSMNPSVFDLRMEGVIVFDRQDGILRNEVASHIFYDRTDSTWKGITTGFSAYANPNEKKQLLAIESKKDPRFGFSVMNATPFGVVGDIEDPHIIYDASVRKWRILTCENVNKGGYKAIMLESDVWNQNYKRIAGPVIHNSTGMSIQQIDGTKYCFSGSDARKIFIYSYPDLHELGTLKMDLPPWDKKSGTRVWPNVVELPEGYPFRYVALMMDRFNYPGLKGHSWTYGAVYLYHGYTP